MDYTPQELALTIRKLIENHPENWRQSLWFDQFSQKLSVESIRNELEQGKCGTTACVAGWAVILVSPAGTKLGGYDTCLNGDLNYVVYPNGHTKLVQGIAAKAFGLNACEAEFLFDSSRMKGDVIAILTAIENGFDWYGDPEFFYPGA